MPLRRSAQDHTCSHPTKVLRPTKEHLAKHLGDDHISTASKPAYIWESLPELSFMYFSMSVIAA